MLHEIDSKRLRAAREMQFMTRGELSAKSGLSESLIAKLEAPRYVYEGVRLQTVRALSKALGAPPDTFVSRTRSREESGQYQAS